MMQQKSYRMAFALALILHLFIIGLLTAKPSTEAPVLAASQINQPSHPQKRSEEEKAIQAVSVDSQEVMETVNRIKAERLEKQRVEEQRQLALKRKAEEARAQRIKEQQRLKHLKDEALRLDKERKKKLEEEQRRLKKIAQQKKAEEKRLAEIKRKQAELKSKQEAEAKRLAALKKKQAELAKAEAERKEQIEAERLAKEAQKRERIAGEVNKYKALIINAISRKWILPDQVASDLSSQFRIRLAPTGAVLEVHLTRSSGDPILDRSAQAAIYKASPLPVPNDPDAFNVFRDIRLTVRPENARG